MKPLQGMKPHWVTSTWRFEMPTSFNTNFNVRAALAATAVAAITLASAGAAQAKSDSVFSHLKGQPGQAGAAAEVYEPAQTLPAPKDSRPFRQTKRVLCNTEEVCTFLLQKVRANRLLELQNISCFTTGMSPGAVLTNSPDPDDLETSVVAVIPAINDSVSATNGAGPYYFKGGEQVIILMSGLAGGVGVCSIYGTISKAG
ncbi:hypothetical protein [Microbaculum marinum]|uniref:Uncharacterized protein n=1 Tax=Microbaculum marinum TaxID=1764581 RepID=A0AAW9RVY0_9HYPH